MNKKALMAATALAVVSCFPLVAHADNDASIDLEVKVESSYVARDPFYDQFGEHAQLQLTPTFNVGNGFFFEPYVYVDLEEGGLEGESSEYGFEAGKTWDWGGCEAETATGVYANYGGLGADVNDTFARLGLTCGGFAVTASGFWGESDVGAFAATYAIELGDAVVVTPGVTYLTDDRTNFGIDVEVALSGNIYVTGVLASAEREDEFGEIERETFGAAGLALRF